MIYKPSLFNFYTEDDQDLLLINFKLGISSFHVVTGEEIDEVKALLHTPRIEVEKKSALMKTMIESGFLVPYEYNEQKERTLLQMDYIYNDRLQLVIHVTADCNFRCKYCFLDFENQKMSLIVQDNVIDFIRKTIHQYSGVYISWFGGEPLMAMDVISYMSGKIINICKRAKKTYMAGITTNGFLLTPANIQILLNLKVYSYCVTLDGLSDTHDNQRIFADGGPTSKVILDNLRHIRDKVKFRYLSICVRTNVTRSIFENLTAYLSFYKEEFGDDHRFSLFLRLADDWGGDRVEAIREELLTPQMMGEIYDVLLEYPHAFALNNFVSLYFGGLTCGAVRKYKYTISTEGIIAKCDTPCPENAIGHLDATGWHIDREKEAEWLLAYQGKNERCRACPFSTLCFQGSCPKKNVFDGKIKACPKPVYMEKLLVLYRKYVDQKEEGISVG